MREKKRSTARSSRPTSMDVSRLAGVSQATVSRAFSNDSLLTPATKKRVLDAASQLGYIPNAIARCMVSAQTNLIGIVVFQNESPFQRNIVNELSKELRARGRYAVMVYQRENETQEETIQNALMYRVDGIFITEAENTDSVAEVCASANVPVMLVSRDVPGSQIATVSCDDYSSCGKIAEYLCRMGIRKAACLAASPKASTTQNRLRGFMDRSKACGIEITAVLYEGRYSYRSGKALAKTLCAQSGCELPDALFCTGDILAIGVMDYLRKERGLRIPEDISVVGFDGIAESEWLSYSLTTMRQPVEEMVAAACDTLIQAIQDPAAKPAHRMFECVLCERDSVKKQKD